MAKLDLEEVKQRITNYFVQDVILIGDYKNKRTSITLHCNDCKHTWSVIAGNVLYIGHDQYKKHCPNCGNHNANRRNGEIVNCSYCHSEIYRNQTQIDNNKTGNFYCSKECGNRHKNEIREQNGEWTNSSNYRRKAFNLYEHKCLICDWNEDERILEVHHIDECREHNEVENLCILCPICHRKLTLGYYTLTKVEGSYIIIPTWARTH